MAADFTAPITVINGHNLQGIFNDRVFIMAESLLKDRCSESTYCMANHT